MARAGRGKTVEDLKNKDMETIMLRGGLMVILEMDIPSIVLCERYYDTRVMDDFIYIPCEAVYTTVCYQVILVVSIRPATIVSR